MTTKSSLRIGTYLRIRPALRDGSEELIDYDVQSKSFDPLI